MNKFDNTETVFFILPYCGHGRVWRCYVRFTHRFGRALVSVGRVRCGCTRVGAPPRPVTASRSCTGLKTSDACTLCTVQCSRCTDTSLIFREFPSSNLIVAVHARTLPGRCTRVHSARVSHRFDSCLCCK